jgi:hypothetical protein
VQSGGGDTQVFIAPTPGIGTFGTNPNATISYVSGSPMLQARDFARQYRRFFTTTDEFAIDDFGQVLRTDGGEDASSTLFTGQNFERRVYSNLFTKGDIDVVMSPSFMFQSGVSQATQKDRSIPSPGPKQ